MGTRSTTKFYVGKKCVLSLYKQYDGYLEGFGKDIKDFIESGKFVNGFSGDGVNEFNGFGDFVLKFVAKFKKGTGDLYLTPETDEEEYNYTIYIDDWIYPTRLEVRCKEEPSYNHIYKIYVPKPKNFNWQEV